MDADNLPFSDDLFIQIMSDGTLHFLMVYIILTETLSEVHSGDFSVCWGKCRKSHATLLVEKNKSPRKCIENLFAMFRRHC